MYTFPDVQVVSAVMSAETMIVSPGVPLSGSGVSPSGSIIPESVPPSTGGVGPSSSPQPTIPASARVTPSSVHLRIEVIMMVFLVRSGRPSRVHRSDGRRNARRVLPSRVTTATSV